jgi:hypothetical protein
MKINNKIREKIISQNTEGEGLLPMTYSHTLKGRVS